MAAASARRACIQASSCQAWRLVLSGTEMEVQWNPNTRWQVGAGAGLIGHRYRLAPDASGLGQIAAESPTLLFELATQLASRLDRTNRKLGDLAFVDVTGRVAHAIMDLCNEPDAMSHPEGTQIKVSRQELSRLVGCSREMAGRVLKVLEDQGLVSASGKTIVVFGARPNRKH